MRRHKGRAPLHYQALLRFSPRDLPTDDVASGFEIHRRYFAVSQKIDESAVKEETFRSDTATFAEGTMVVVELEIVTASTRRFVVVDDALPGGFEGVDPDLRTTPLWLRGYLATSITGLGSRGSSRVSAVQRTEHRDDRTLFFADELSPGSHRMSYLVRATTRGSFVTPPARVEEMYTPETFGRTGARVVKIVAPGGS